MIVEIIGLILAVAAYYIYKNITALRFWKSRGVPGPEPTLFIGNYGSVLKGKHSFGQVTRHYYNSYKNEPYIGVYFQGIPQLLLRDLDLIKDVFISDFSKFPDRFMETFEVSDPLSQSLLQIDHVRWRPLRNKLSPVFTSGKLKEMFSLMVSCSENLQHCMDKLVAKNNIIDARELASKYTIDVIGTCGFGLELKALENDNSEFIRMGKKALSSSLKQTILFIMRENFPKTVEFFGPLLRDNEISSFFINLMNDTMDYRRSNKIARQDFLQYLMGIKDNPESLPEIKLTDSFLASQLFLFFLAAFETSSLTMSHALYELALNHDCQDKLRQEIQETNKATNGKLTYEAIKNMKYLDRVVKETLRMYPPVPVLKRISITNYQFSGTNLSIPKKTGILIPADAIHHDPKVYPNPETFNPENFSEEAIASRHPIAFLTFGNGPRNCIGERFGYQQTRIGLFKILERYRVDVSDQTDIPYKLNPHSFMQEPLNKVQLKFIKV